MADAPVPPISAMFIHLLSVFVLLGSVMLESHPPSAAPDKAAAVTHSTIAASSTTRWRRFRIATDAETAAAIAKTVAYHRRLNRTSSIGLSITAQKFGDIAIAVKAAILNSGMCSAAMSWGSTKKTKPVLNPSVVLDSPISHTGGTRRLEFK